jgi:hypothetical protein
MKEMNPQYGGERRSQNDSYVPGAQGNVPTMVYIKRVQKGLQERETDRVV